MREILHFDSGAISRKRLLCGVQFKRIAVTYAVGNSAEAIVAGDFNGDNRIDLAVAGGFRPGCHFARQCVGREALTQVLRSLKLQSIDRVDNLQTLRKIVLAMEGTAQGTTMK